MNALNYPGCNVGVAMRLLWDSSKRSQILLKENYHSGMGLLKELCTVTIGTARQSGHDTAIVEMLDQFKGTVAIVVPNVAMRTHMKLKLLKHPKYEEGQVKLYLANHPESLRGLDLDAVFVNCAFLVSDKKMHEIQEVCQGYAKQKTFGFFIVQ